MQRFINTSKVNYVDKRIKKIMLFSKEVFTFIKLGQILKEISNYREIYSLLKPSSTPSKLSLLVKVSFMDPVWNYFWEWEYTNIFMDTSTTHVCLC